MSEENLMLEVSGSSSKAVSAMEKVISKLQLLQTSFAAAVPSITAFNNALNSIGAKSESSYGKLATSVAKITQSVDKQTVSNAKAESQMAMYQARMDRASASSAKAQSAMDKIADSNKKTADEAKFAAEAEQSLSDAIARCVSAGKEAQSSVGLPTTAKVTGSKTASEILGGSLGIEEAMSGTESVKSKTSQLVSSLNTVKEPASKASQAITAFGDSAEKVSKKTSGLTGVLSNLKTYVLTGLVYKTAGYLADSIKSAMSYTENMNLFNVAMGDTAAQAGKFVDSMQKAFGLDPNNLIKNMGVFYQVSTSMGVTSKNAYTLSENFTKLSEDIASYYNISIESANEKLNAGLVGQTKPLRSIGVIITQNALQQTAYNNGIRESVKNMTEAEKIHLRYLTILQQTKNAQGDFARTLNSPMNNMRILTEQMSQLSRAIGSLFIPILVNVLPYVIAFARALTIVISGMATLAGYEAPAYKDSSYGFGNLSDDADDASKSIGGTTDKVKELQRTVMGFDEINLLQKPADTSTSGSAGGGAGAGGDNLGIGDFKGYDNLMGTIQDKTKKITDSIVKFITDFTTSVKNSEAWKIISDFWNNIIKPLGEWILQHPGTVLDFILPIVTAIGTFKIAKEAAGWIEKLTGSLNVGGGLGGVLLNLGSKAGWIALAVAAIAGIGVAVWEVRQNIDKADLDGRFGKIQLSIQEVKQMAEQLTTTKFTAKVDVIISQKAKLSEIEEGISSDIETINRLNWKVSVGIKLSESDKADYKTSVDQFIQKSIDWVQQKQYTAAITLNTVFGDGSKTGENLVQTSNAMYAGINSDLVALGKKLSKAVNDAFADGVLDEKEALDIAGWESKIQATMDKVADAQFKAKLKVTEMKYDGSELTADSFKQLSDEITKDCQSQLDKTDTILTDTITEINLQYSEGKIKTKEAYDAAIKEAEEKMNQNKADIVLKGITFKMDALNNAFKTELGNSSSIWGLTLRDAFSSACLAGVRNPDDIYKADINTLVSGMEQLYRTKIDAMNLSGPARDNIKKMVDALQPTKEQLEKIRDSAQAAGEKVPDGVNEGLTEIAKLEALTGSTQAIHYLIGEQLSTDPKFKETLQKAKNAGVDIDAQLVYGLNSGKVGIVSTAYSAGSNAGTSLMNGASVSILNGQTVVQQSFNKVFSSNSVLAYSVGKAGTSYGTTFGNNFASAIKNTKLPQFKWEYSNSVYAYKDSDGVVHTPATGKSQLTWNANGGFYDKATVVGIGEAGPEAALPLNDAVYSQIAKGIVSNSPERGYSTPNSGLDAERLISAIGDRIDGLENAIRNMNVTLYTNDREIANSANRGNDSISRRYGNK